MKKFFARIGKFFKDEKTEMKKVIWPSRKQLINNTAIVLIFVLIIGLIIWLLDLLFGFGAQSLLG